MNRSGSVNTSGGRGGGGGGGAALMVGHGRAAVHAGAQRRLQRRSTGRQAGRLAGWLASCWPAMPARGWPFGSPHRAPAGGGPGGPRGREGRRPTAAWWRRAGSARAGAGWDGCRRRGRQMEQRTEKGGRAVQAGKQERQQVAAHHQQRAPRPSQVMAAAAGPALAAAPRTSRAAGGPPAGWRWPRSCRCPRAPATA